VLGCASRPGFRAAPGPARVRARGARVRVPACALPVRGGGRASGPGPEASELRLGDSVALSGNYQRQWPVALLALTRLFFVEGPGTCAASSST
jgi:hypothetical protein